VTPTPTKHPLRAHQMQLSPVAYAVAIACITLSTTSAFAQSGGPINPEVRPLSFSLGQAISHDSNVFRLSSAGVVPAAYGNTTKSDIISRTYGAISYDNVISKQEIHLRAELDFRRYSTYSQLNRNSYGISASWKGDIDRAIYGAANVGLNSTATEFYDQTGLTTNQIRTDQIGATVGYRFTPSWSAFTRFELVDRRNSSGPLQTGNIDSRAYEVGGRFEPSSGVSGELVLRKRTVDFPNPQTVLIAGVPSSFSNSFNSDQFIARLNYNPNNISSFSGQIGTTKLSFDQLTQRNSSGYLANIRYSYNYSNALGFGAVVSRDVANDSVSFASPIAVTRLNGEINWRPTARIAVTANGSVTKRNFSSDPSVIAGVNPLTSDRIQAAGVSARYELLRTVFLTASLTRQSRSAPVPSAVFNSTMASIGVDFKVD
jgi:Putative beta-barrel porin 2